MYGVIDTGFQGFPKISRLMRDVVVTEKIDGTNGQINVVPQATDVPPEGCVAHIQDASGTYAIYAGSRNRWLQPTKSNDNHGFAGWVKDNAADLVKLGPGRHFGEWWGSGIARGYGLPKGEKRFSLFNVHRWADAVGTNTPRPECCHVVPTLWMGQFDTDFIYSALFNLREGGSVASPGFMNPEGIIAYHTASGVLFKQTIANDNEPKSVAA